MVIDSQLWNTQLDMIGNTMILFMVYLLAEAALPRLPWLASRARRQWVLVVVYSLLASLNVMTAYEPAAGVRLDTRMGVEAAATLTLGPLAGFVVGVVTGLTRVSLGGPGWLSGSLAMLGVWGATSALMVWQARRRPGEEPGHRPSVVIGGAIFSWLMSMPSLAWLDWQGHMTLDAPIVLVVFLSSTVTTLLLWAMIALTSSRTQALEQLSQANAALQQSLRQTIGALAQAVLHRDPGSARHQRRVAELALAVGRTMNLAPQQLEGLEFAALVHDIGQIEIPSEIISRPGPLTPAEMALVQQHPVMGFEILKDVQSPWPLADIVHQHHENLDGSGYPRGLRGDEICLEARILRVCDIVEAMSSHRVYRSSHPLESVLHEIQRMAGKELDADVVRICVDLIQRQGYAFPP